MVNEPVAISLGYAEYLERAARIFKERPATISESGTMLTFEQVNERATAIARFFLDRGLRPGDRVADLQWNRPEVVEIDFGLARAGLIRVPLNARAGVDDLSFITTDAQPRALISSADFADAVAQLKDTTPSIELVLGLTTSNGFDYEDAIEQGRRSMTALPRVTGRDVLSLKYTGGTTGRPKGVIRTHAAQIQMAMNMLMDLCDFRPTDTLLQSQPMSHGAGGFVLPSVIRGSAQHILPRFDAEKVLRLIDGGDITLIKLVPTMLLRLVKHFDEVKPDVSNLRQIIYGASPMPEAPLREALRLFGPVLSQTYGQTECPATISCLTVDDHTAALEGDGIRLRSAGRPYSTVSLRIVDEGGKDLPAGERGEIAVRAPMNTDGYWQNDEATAELYREGDGWIFTRDLGYLDDDGYLFLVDRKGDVIITGGFNVYPTEVEDVLYTHPDVVNAAVVGIPSTEWGQAVVAGVSVSDSSVVTEAELLEYCATRLGSYKRPKELRILPELPLSPAGKVMRREVGEILQDALGAGDRP